MNYSKQQSEELYNKYKKLVQETETLASDVDTCTSDAKTSYIISKEQIEKIKEKNGLAKELCANCQAFLDTLQPNEKFDIQIEAKKDLSD